MEVISSRLLYLSRQFQGNGRSDQWTQYYHFRFQSWPVPLHRSRRSGKRSDRKRQCQTGRQQKQIGGIVGTNRGTIENCEFHGMVSGQEAIGGIAGTNEEGAVIRGCKSYSVTTGNNKTGGITGNNDGTVEQCEKSRATLTLWIRE